MIYRESFVGSKQEVVRRKYRTDPNNRYTEFERICMPMSRQSSLLRTCREVYKEARHVFWSETTIRCAYMPFQINLDAIPVYARQRIRALENVVTEDHFRPMNRMPLVQFLGNFTRLQHCHFRPQTVHIFCHHNEIPPEGLLRMVGSDAFRDLALALNIDQPPVFVQRIYVWPQKDRDVSKMHIPFTYCSSHLPLHRQEPGIPG